MERRSIDVEATALRRLYPWAYRMDGSQMERKRAEAEASATVEAEARLEEEDVRPALQAAERELAMLQERRAQAMAEVPHVCLPPPPSRFAWLEVLSFPAPQFLRHSIVCLWRQALVSTALGNKNICIQAPN